MRLRLLLLLFLLSAPSLACGAEPKLVVPPGPIAAGDLVQIQVAGLAAGDLPKAALCYYPRDRVTFIPAATWGGEAVIMFSAREQGKYLVALFTPGPNGAVLKTEAEVLVGNPPPGPGPQPEPGPGPKPQPIPAGKLWLICVVQDATRPTPGLAAIPSSQELRRSIDSRGNHFRWVDPQNAPADLAPYVQAALEAGLPRALVASAAEADLAKAKSCKELIRESVPLGDAKAVTALVEKWTAK